MDDNINSSDFRTVRGYQLANRREGRLTSAMEDYLEMACRLCLQNGHTRIGKLSELLNVKPPSATKMVSKLAALGYLQYDRYEIVRMTESGQKLGEYLLRRHDTVETFLRMIGCAEPLEETELIEHSLSASTVADIATLVGFFETDGEVLERFSRYRACREK
jgi:Mn-dependent DtxR family transcriptional regulator